MPRTSARKSQPHLSMPLRMLRPRLIEPESLYYNCANRVKTGMFDPLGTPASRETLRVFFFIGHVALP